VDFNVDFVNVGFGFELWSALANSPSPVLPCFNLGCCPVYVAQSRVNAPPLMNLG